MRRSARRFPAGSAGDDPAMRALFVCTVNRCRSPTAEWLYGCNPEHMVASAGVDRSAATVVDAELLQWAERIFVFERMHRNRSA
jgi:predicted protein tyrosine phosphatase